METEKTKKGDAYSKIAEFFAQYNYYDSFISIKEIAQIIGVSESSIVRYCQKKGYKGYKEFSLDLANTKGIQIGSGFGVDIPTENHTDSTLKQFVKNVFLINCEVILKTLDTLDLDELQIVIERIKTAKSILVIGYGNSSPIATDICLRLSRLSYKVSNGSDPYSDALKINNLDKDDLLIAVSYSGSSTSLIQGIQLAKNNKAQRVLITSTPESHAAKYCDNVLVTAQSNARDESISTRTAQLSLLDAIFAKLVYGNSLSVYESHVKRVDEYLLGMHL